MIFAKIETMEHLPECCNDCFFQEDGGWCDMLPNDKQSSPVIAYAMPEEKVLYKGVDGQVHLDRYACGRRKDCPLRESFREIYSECVGMETSSTETFERESRC